MAMLSGVLHSSRAIQVNIAIMRIFTKLRSFLDLESTLEDKVSNIEKGTNKLFKIVFEGLDTLEEQIAPRLPGNQKRIGIHPNK